MAWIYVDDAFPDHPKVVEAGGDAGWLWLCGMAYVKRYGTGGTIPKAQVPKLSDRRAPQKLARRLVDAGLWHDDGDAYRVHDYGDWNKPQESRSAAGRKAAKARWAREAHANGNANAYADASESHTDSDSDPPYETDEPHLPQDAHHPVPIPTVKTKGGEPLQAAAPPAPPQGSPPQRKCPAHSHIDGPGPPCGQCADHRREHDAWQQQHQVTPLDGTAAAQRRRTETEHAAFRSIVAEPPDPEAAEHVRQLRETALRPTPGVEP